MPVAVAVAVPLAVAVAVAVQVPVAMAVAVGEATSNFKVALPAARSTCKVTMRIIERFIIFSMVKIRLQLTNSPCAARGAVNVHIFDTDFVDRGVLC